MDPLPVQGLGSLRDRVVKGASWTLAGAVLGRTVSLVGTIVATRLLSPSRFGQLSAVQLMVGTFAGIAGLGLGVAVTKRVAEHRTKDPARVSDFTRSATRIVAASGGVTTLVVILGRGWLADTWFHSPELATPLALASGMVLTSALLGVQIGILIGMEAFKQAALATALRNIFTALLLVIGIKVAGMNGALAGAVLGEVATLLWVIPAVARLGTAPRISIYRRGGPGAWSSLRKVGLPAVIASISVLLSLLVGQRILVGQPDGFVDVAQFSVAYRWSLVVLFIPASISPVMLPLLSNLAGANARAAFQRLLTGNFLTLTLVTAIPAVLMILCRRFVLGLSGGSYRSDTAAFVILMGATVPIVWNTILSQAALALEAIAAWLISDLVLALALVAGAVLLVPDHHSAGLAAAYAVAYGATCAVLFLPVLGRARTLGSAA
jgi:O-antigen/teichoic acid export membrane protein